MSEKHCWKDFFTRCLTQQTCRTACGFLLNCGFPPRLPPPFAYLSRTEEGFAREGWTLDRARGMPGPGCPPATALQAPRTLDRTCWEPVRTQHQQIWVQSRWDQTLFSGSSFTASLACSSGHRHTEW